MYPALKNIDRQAHLGGIDPQSIAGGNTISSGWVNMQLFGSLLVLIQTGVITATGSVTAQLYQATSAAGAGSKVITGKATSTALTAAANSPSAQVEINLKGEELDVSNGFSFVQVQVSAVTAAALASATILGCDPREGPASQNIPATLVQLIG